MTLPVAGLLAAYVVVTMLLLSLNLTSLWRWWIKAASIIVTTVFFGVTWHSINGLMGWPTAQHLPPRFSLVSSRIVEPDGRTNNPGHIYLWLDTINEYNVPSGMPRSYEIAYSKGLARKVNGAQEKHDQGIEVMESFRPRAKGQQGAIGAISSLAGRNGAATSKARRPTQSRSKRRGVTSASRTFPRAPPRQRPPAVEAVIMGQRFPLARRAQAGHPAD